MRAGIRYRAMAIVDGARRHLAEAEEYADINLENIYRRCPRSLVRIEVLTNEGWQAYDVRRGPQRSHA